MDTIGRCVTDLTLISPDEAPRWLAALGLPAGWQTGRAENSPVQPTRTTVHRRDLLTGWDACETINVFRFKGVPPHDIIQLNADCTLRAGGAQDITIHSVKTPVDARMTAVRSSGYLVLADQRSIWAQYSTYLAGDDTQGLLVEQGIFAASDRHADLRNEITELRNAVHNALVSTMTAGQTQSLRTADLSAEGDLSLSERTDMAIFRVGFFPDFDWGDAVVLVGADRDGMRRFQSAVRSAHDEGAADFESDGIKHYVVRQDGAADIELGPQIVVWRFDTTKLKEMLDLIEPLVDAEGPGHQYVDDLNSPAEILILSVDEYTRGGPFAEFPQGMGVPPSR